MKNKPKITTKITSFNEYCIKEIARRIINGEEIYFHTARGCGKTSIMVRLVEELIREEFIKEYKIIKSR